MNKVFQSINHCAHECNDFFIFAVMIRLMNGYELRFFITGEIICSRLPSFTLKHVEEEGIEGSVEFQFMATTAKKPLLRI